MKLNFGLMHSLLAMGGIFASAAMKTPITASPGYRGSSYGTSRYRGVNTNATERKYSGLPHGTSGAKLIRKAAAGTVGKAALR